MMRKRLLSSEVMRWSDSDFLERKGKDNSDAWSIYGFKRKGQSAS